MRYLLATAAAVLLTATPANANPVQCKSACPGPSQQRLELKAQIHFSLPNLQTRWSVYCTPDHPVTMTCWARNQDAKYVRRYGAEVRPTGFTLRAVPPWKVGALKHGLRVDGVRG